MKIKVIEIIYETLLLPCSTRYFHLSCSIVLVQKEVFNMLVYILKRKEKERTLCVALMLNLFSVFHIFFIISLYSS